MTGLPIAIDAMGGDKAPVEIIAGAKRARDEHNLDLVLVGPESIRSEAGELDLMLASEVIAMDEDPTKAVRIKKDSSIVVAAEAVRDKQASAMISAGNTGAVMAAALLRMGRLPQVARPCIATPLVIPGDLNRHPTVMVDAGANVECQPAWLVQFAQMAAAYAKLRYKLPKVTVALLSNGEEASKGNPLTKETHELLSATKGIDFIGNVEGRDLLAGKADVIVTDGFTGNVALKSLEGALSVFMDVLFKVIGTDENTKAAGNVLIPHLLTYGEALDPESTGGALLLGVDGICVISHGSSSAKAILNAALLADDMAKANLVEGVKEAILS